MDFKKIRKEYEDQGIVFSDLADDPFDQFRIWYAEAETHCPEGWIEPNGMALATTDLAGNVSVRWVLLKGVVENGFRFYTNYESQKGVQLAENPKAALAFHWSYLGRQVRIEGVTQKTTREVSREYFHSRPRGSQLGALASAQSEPVADRADLEQRRDKLKAELEGKPVPLPENWGGYLLQPNRFEFWQGRSDRLHDRAVYTLSNRKWETLRLSP